MIQLQLQREQGQEDSLLCFLRLLRAKAFLTAVLLFLMPEDDEPVTLDSLFLGQS